MKKHRKTPAKPASTPKLQKRPVHKENLRLARIQAELDHKRPEPMSLFHKREKQGMIPDPKLPLPQHGMGVVDRAAKAMADWDNSDPFAYNRTALYVRQGYLRPDEIIKEMGMRTLARRAARIKEVDDATRKS